MLPRSYPVPTADETHRWLIGGPAEQGIDGASWSRAESAE